MSRMALDGFVLKDKDGFLSLDFGLKEFGEKNFAVSDRTDPDERLLHYRRFLYEKGGIPRGQPSSPNGFDVPGKIEDRRQEAEVSCQKKEREKEYKLNEFDRFQ